MEAAVGNRLVDGADMHTTTCCQREFRSSVAYTAEVSSIARQGHYRLSMPQTHLAT